MTTLECAPIILKVFSQTIQSLPFFLPIKPRVHSRERRPLIRHGNIVCNSRVHLNELKTGASGEVDFDTSNNQENLSVHVQETQSESCYRNKYSSKLKRKLWNTQTLLPKQKDASNQHNLPHITPEDLRGDNEKKHGFIHVLFHFLCFGTTFKLH